MVDLMKKNLRFYLFDVKIIMKKQEAKNYGKGKRQIRK